MNRTVSGDKVLIGFHTFDDLPQVAPGFAEAAESYSLDRHHNEAQLLPTCLLDSLSEVCRESRNVDRNQLS